MPMRIRSAEVAQVLADAGHHPSEFEDGDWDPGYRCVQVGPRAVHLVHDGVGEQGALTEYTELLRARDYHVQADQPLGTRHRLIVTRP